MGEILNTLFKNLKIYGEILINFTYLEAIYEQKVIKGNVYYVSPEDPSICITCV